MKKILYVILLMGGLAVFGRIQAQSSDSVNTQTTSGIDAYTNLAAKSNRFLNHIEVDLGFGWSILQNTPVGMEFFWFNSVNWHVNVLYRHYFLDNLLSFSVGAGVDGQRLRFDDESLFLVREDHRVVIGTPEEFGILPEESTNSVLAKWHVSAPVFIGVHPLSYRERSLGFALGILPKYTFNTVAVIDYDRLESSHSVTIRRDFNINPWQLDLEFRTLFGPLYLYYRHNILPYFEHGRGPDNYFYVHTIGLGLTTLP